MSKNKGFDVIADAQERADHPYDTPYWFNRATSFTLARWKANKYFAPIFFIGYTVAGILGLASLHQTALATNQTFWSFLFDFSDGFTTARFTGLLLFLAFWVIAGIATAQTITQRAQGSLSTSKPEHRKEKKKKYPRRPKNYK